LDAAIYGRLINAVVFGSMLGCCAAWWRFSAISPAWR